MSLRRSEYCAQASTFMGNWWESLWKLQTNLGFSKKGYIRLNNLVPEYITRGATGKAITVTQQSGWIGSERLCSAYNLKITG